MVQFKDAQTYFAQSKLLIQARPSTTRITTKYSVPKPRPGAANRVQKHSTDATTTSTAPAPGGSNAETPAPRATMTLKTYDPVSGTCLKYQTDKQAEVGRLIAGLGRLARDLAALPDRAADEAVPEAGAGAGAGGDGSATPMEVDGGAQQTAGTAAGGAQAGKQAGGGGAAGGGSGGGSGGGKKGKKKGKK